MADHSRSTQGRVHFINASAQTTTSVDMGSFEVISVDGNKLVVRNEKGTHEYTVPNDFRFTVDGKQLRCRT